MLRLPKLFAVAVAFVCNLTIAHLPIGISWRDQIAAQEAVRSDEAPKEPAKTAQAEASAKPNTTAKPEATAKPNTTAKPNKTAKPEGNQEPELARLQILNGSGKKVEIYRLIGVVTDGDGIDGEGNDGEGNRELVAVVEPDKNKMVRTRIGEKITVVEPESQSQSVVTCVVPVQGYRVGGIPECYTQRTDAQGFPIVATANVSPYALKEAVYLVDQMLAHRPDIRTAMIQSGARLCIIGWNEFTTDLPEWDWLARNPLPDYPGISPKDFYDARARGMGGSLFDPFCSCGEENLLCYPGDPYSTENILIHEFAHNIHLRGLVNVDPTFDNRLKKAYESAMEQGLWKSKYASVSYHEYFAEGVQSWFDNNRQDDHDHNHVNTRQELIEYDPGLADLCKEVFGETQLRYTKPQTRLSDHLSGYDPSTAPTFVWPDRIKHAQREILRRAQSR